MVVARPATRLQRSSVKAVEQVEDHAGSCWSKNRCSADSSSPLPAEGVEALAISSLALQQR